jgi:hypothetical protein
VKCVECLTTGNVVASAMLPDLGDIDITNPGGIFDDSMLGLTFNGVGATINLDVAAEASGDVSLPLLKTESPIGIAVSLSSLYTKLEVQAFQDKEN